MSSKAILTRRKKLEKELGEGAVLILYAGPEKIRNHDVHYPYRAGSNFQYLAGFEEPEAILVGDFRDKPSWTIFLEPRDEHMAVWLGERPGLEEMAGRHHFSEAFPLEAFHQKLPKLLSGADQIHTVIGDQPHKDGQLLKAWADVRGGARRGTRAPFALVDAWEMLGALRLIKDSEEIAALKKAALATAQGHAAAREAAVPGVYEYQVQAALENGFRQAGAQRLGYESIVASGPNACVLHYVENRRRLEKGDLLLIDAGAEVDGYTADITRTAAIGAAPDKKQREILNIVLEAQQAAMEAACPGSNLIKVHEAALKVLIKGLISIKALKGNPKTILKEGSYVPFYPHGTSHWLGLDVHDPCPYRDAAGEPMSLAPGMVFTIEPGLYFRGEAAKLAPAYAGIGVRTEDDVLITKNGHEVLTAMVPKDLRDA